MKWKLVRVAMCLVVVTLLCCAAWAQAGGTPAQWKPVEAALGRSGAMQPGDIIKFGMPRAELHVKLGNVDIKPALALGSWAAFKAAGKGAMVMGDLVLTTDEVEPVMLKLESGGIEITAVHNHLIGEMPRIVYMHIDGRGDAAKLAQTLHDAVALTGTPAPSSAPAPPAPAFDTAEIAKILGHAGNMNGGVFQVGVPRAEKITDQGVEVPPSMGVATGLNFQPTGKGRAAITGDFVLLGSEVNPVIRTLRQNGIAVTALHSHMLMEQPRLFFMHFWAEGDAAHLAHGLRAALDQTNSVKPK